MQFLLSRLKSNSQKMAFVAGSLILLAAAIYGIRVYVRHQPSVKNINYTELRALSDNPSAIASLTVDGELMLVTGRDGSLSQSTVPPQAQQEIIAAYFSHKIPIEFRSLKTNNVTVALGYIFPLMLLGGFGLLAWKISGVVGGNSGNFQLANSQGHQKVTFFDVAGVDEAKAELSETIEFLRDPETFGRLGGRAPRGILLSGPPGTGKTLLARAAANEAGVAFLSASGSSFQEKYVGVGAQRVRRLFAEARRLAPCVVFIDEIDAMGRQRGRGGDSASAEQDQTLNQLLVEMDGFDQLFGVVVIASTNRPDILDSALTRPGRFDREIMVNLADARGREAILNVHSKNLKIEEGLDLKWIARGTPGFSGADLANLLNESAIAATRDGSSAIARKHIEYARDKILMGVERAGFRMDEEERYVTAVHEAGHVAVGLLVENGDPIHKVSILARGRALGVTQSLPERDRLMKKRNYLEDQIAVLLGGRAAEQMILDTMTAGASNDIERAVEIARKMVAEFGMSPLGPIHLGKPEDPHSQALLDRIDAATSDIIKAQLERACEIVQTRHAEIMKLVEALLEHDTLEAEEIHSCFNIGCVEEVAA
jgi:cell division protease FtsH